MLNSNDPQEVQSVTRPDSIPINGNKARTDRDDDIHQQGNVSDLQSMSGMNSVMREFIEIISTFELALSSAEVHQR